MFSAYGRFLYRFRWPTLGVAGVLLLISLALAPSTSGVLKNGGFQDTGSDSYRAGEIAIEKLGAGRSSVVPVFSSPTLRADDPAFRGEVERLLNGVKADPSVLRISSYTNGALGRFVADDGHLAYAVIDLKEDYDASTEVVPRLRERLRSAVLDVKLAGTAAFNDEVTVGNERDLRRATQLSLPVSLVILLLVFGGVIAAGLPLAVALLSVVGTVAAIGVIARFTELSIYTVNTSEVLGLGLAIDYSLFLVSRFREELGKGGDVETALARTMATAGRSVFFSGITVCIGLLALLFFPMGFLISSGIGGAAVVFLTVVYALTLLPALMAVLGRRVSWGRVPLPRLGRPAAGDGVWHRIALFVMDRPVLVLLGVLALLLALGSPFLHVSLGVPDARALPRGTESRVAFDSLLNAFPRGQLTTVDVVVQAPGPVLAPGRIGPLYDYAQRLGRLPHVTSVVSAVSIDPRITREQYQQLLAIPPAQWPAVNPQLASFAAAMPRLANDDTAVIHLVLDLEYNAPEAQQLVRDLRAMPPGGDFRVYVGGSSAYLVDLVAGIGGALPKVFAFVAVVSYIVLFLLFGSVFLPLKAVFMNSLSILASFGALVWVFQDGHLSGLLGFDPLGHIDATIPALLFCTLFGLSMDYEVFLLTRVKEEYDRTGDHRLSVALGIERTGRIITSAALLFVVVAGSFALGEIVVLKELGVGLAVAVLVDATVVRALLVPATMRLMGRWNWWAPGPLRRLWARVGLSEAETAPETVRAPEPVEAG